MKWKNSKDIALQEYNTLKMIVKWKKRTSDAMKIELLPIQQKYSTQL